MVACYNFTDMYNEILILSHHKKQETGADKMIEDAHGWILNGGVTIIMM